MAGTPTQQNITFNPEMLEEPPAENIEPGPNEHSEIPAENLEPGPNPEERFATRAETTAAPFPIIAPEHLIRNGNLYTREHNQNTDTTGTQLAPFCTQMPKKPKNLRYKLIKKAARRNKKFK